MDFLRQILSGDKKYVSTKNLRIVEVPRWEEFSAVKILEFASQDSRFKDFLPNLDGNKFIKYFIIKVK